MIVVCPSHHTDQIDGHNTCTYIHPFACISMLSIHLCRKALSVHSAVHKLTHMPCALLHSICCCLSISCCSCGHTYCHCYCSCCWCWIWSQTAKVLIGCIIYCFSLRRAAISIWHFSFWTNRFLFFLLFFTTKNAFNICLSSSKLLRLPKLLSSLIIPYKSKKRNALQNAVCCVKMRWDFLCLRFCYYFVGHFN